MPLILLVQAVSLLIALRNTAFQDEALYLLTGRQIFLSWPGKMPYVEPYGLYFSGYPSFYPVIGGGLDFLGGLETARMSKIARIRKYPSMIPSQLIFPHSLFYTTHVT